MNNKVKFLRGTSNEYAVAEKDSDTIYFTTDDGKLYIGDKEVSGSDIIIDDTLSDTSTNPVQNKIVKQAIDNKADKTVATTSADGLMSAEDKGKLDNADNTYALKAKYGDTTIDVGRKSGTTVGKHSTAEGYFSTASGDYSHAEGASTTASGNRSHAEGYLCTASSDNSHAEGNNTTASGAHSHSEGDSTIASGIGSHSGGTSSIASGNYSFAHGIYVKSNNSLEVSLGKFNKSSSDTLFSIGDGTSDSARHNAFEITTTGGKIHDKDIATTDLIPSSLPANGGVAENISEWGTRTYSDLNNADFGFSVSCSDVGHLNAPNSFWSTVLTTGSNDTDGFKTQFAFPWSADTSNQKMKYRVMNDNVWHDWSEMYTSSNKPYVTGSATIPADSDTCTTYHGFMPSAAIWWYDDICGAAVSFNENQITVGSTSSTYRTINYLIFK